MAHLNVSATMTDLAILSGDEPIPKESELKLML